MGAIFCRLLDGEVRPRLLKLKGTPEFLSSLDTACPESRDNKYVKFRMYKALPEREKLKVSTFPARKLRVGYWEMEAEPKNEIVADFFYVRRSLAWEVMHGGMRRKIEIPWNDVSGIGARFNAGKPSILEIQLENTPSFFVEDDPRPRKHVSWRRIEDFTRGEAARCRIHTLAVDEGILEEHYDKLMHSSGWLFSKRMSPSLLSCSSSVDPVRNNRSYGSFGCSNELIALDDEAGRVTDARWYCHSNRFHMIDAVGNNQNCAYIAPSRQPVLAAPRVNNLQPVMARRSASAANLQTRRAVTVEQVKELLEN